MNLTATPAKACRACGRLNGHANICPLKACATEKPYIPPHFKDGWLVLDLRDEFIEFTRRGLRQLLEGGK